MKLKQRIVERIYKGVLDGKKDTSSGCCARFIRLSKHWGFKWYASLRDCLQTHEMQSRAHKQGWAPALGNIVSFRGRYKGDNEYGYAVQYATTWKAYHGIDPSVRWCDGDFMMDEDRNSLDFDYYSLPDFHELSDQCGFTGHDFHYQNVAYLADDTVVVIDFSECRFNDGTTIARLEEKLHRHLTQRGSVL
jgi:hypothetical protein